MDVSGRTSKVSSVIATLCIFIYIGAVAFGAFRIVMDIADRRNLAHREFMQLAERATSNAVFYGFPSQAYNISIQGFMGSSQTLTAAIIFSSSGDLFFERFPGSGIIWAGNAPRFRSGIGFPSQPFFLPLRIENQAHANIQAIHSTINNTFLVSVLRDTLLAVLVALAIAFFTLLIELIGKKRQHYQFAQTGAVSAHEAEDPFDFGEAARGVTGVEPETGNFSGKEFTEEFKTEDFNTESFDTSEDSPQGLFSPRSNIGWESYTRDRLSSEIHRCAASEQDLVLIVMEFKYGGNLSDDQYRLFADEAVSFFIMRDLIFEKGEDGISVIIPSIDLESGITKCEEFQNRVVAKLPDAFGKAKLFIGLSSRSGRLIDSNRLIMEASLALDKTQEYPISPIVAFKSDPEKYRNFIKKRSYKL